MDHLTIAEWQKMNYDGKKIYLRRKNLKCGLYTKSKNHLNNDEYSKCRLETRIKYT